MSYSEAAIPPSMPLNKGTVTSSLKVRQLISMLIVVAMGISLLGGGYLSVYSANAMDAVGKQQRLVAEALILKVPVLIDDDSYPDTKLFLLKEFLDKERFSHGFDDDGTEHEYYAYFEDPETGLIVWQSKFPELNMHTENRHGRGGFVKKFKFSNELGAEPELKERLLPSYKENSSDQLKFIVYTRMVERQDLKPLRLVLAKSAIAFNNDWANVQTTIVVLFFSTLALVLVSQLISNYFIITPIRDFEEEVRSIESGAQDAITKAYPVELTEVKGAINTLINVEKGQKKRYRESFDKLAHSIKTPLAEIQSTALSKYNLKEEDKDHLMDKISQMSDIVAYQLNRAAVSTPNAIIKSQPLRPILYRLRDSLKKVYHHQDFEIEIHVDDIDTVRMEYDDLMELFGNLMNNSCRFCDSVVDVNATREANFLVVNIDDDGMGFSTDNPADLLKRGMRDDSKTEGQGIGLAMSTEIVQAVGGKIELKVSPQVGARVRLYLPI
jgi:signal transduction histidine kinase